MEKRTGVGAAPGLCLGQVRVVPKRQPLRSRPVQAAPQEQALFEAARILAKDELGQLMAAAPEAEADIFLFQQTMVDDGGLNRAIAGYIGAGQSAAAAVEKAGAEFAARLLALQDGYISQRAADVQDVCTRLVDILDGRPRTRFTLHGPAVVVAEDILPSDLLAAKRDYILGFVTSLGAPTGHATILARSMGIPAVIMAGDLSFVKDDTLCALDGATGEVFFAPDEATKTRFLHRINLAKRRSLSREKLMEMPCITKSGVHVQLLANCSNAGEVAAAVAAGAEGVGLLRSEFLYMQKNLPSEEEQYEFYKSCLLAAAGRPVTIRTFDIGADKRISGISQAEEENPALGLRGLRLALAKEELFLPHLKALLRAGLHGAVKVMFPMVCGKGEFLAAMEIVEKAKKQLALEGVQFCEDVPFGTMIETPAAALLAEELAEEAAFFSLGTNDLTQYTLAADRVNPAVVGHYNPANPAVMALVGMAVAAGQKAGRPISVCGEAASESKLAKAYVKMGITSLSMAAPSILEVKEALLNDEDF